ncbi:hypothetical protein C1H46_043281 [Malus baccata]|uniref:50S ribosomal protein L33, chloroplastic n=1 Tax=Malus baccata TaxID=106549 RepID=A0A540KAD6_MALBA|nr:hypothetical protein C1H46_043281 [Malus baccata]
MGEKKKKATLFIRLISAAGTGFFYVKKKPSRVQEKLEFRKFDPRALCLKVDPTPKNLS